MAEGVKRRYNSSRRQEQAQENRRRIIVAAQALFVDKGYGRTTIADIAGAAGVAAETVYSAFRNKPTLLHRAWDVAVGAMSRTSTSSTGPRCARSSPSPTSSPG